jgi:hypothetical protein
VALLWGSAVCLPLRADEAPAGAGAPAPATEAAPADALAPEPQTGEVELSSRISPVDACNRAQGLRPAGATVTAMHYERLGEAGERVFTCRVLWSTAADARPTGRPILFGPTL